MRPDTVFQLTCFLVANIPVDLQYITFYAFVLLFSKAQGRLKAFLRDFQNIGEIDLGGVLGFDQAHIQVCWVACTVVKISSRKANNDICEVLLWLNIETAIMLARRDLLVYLFDCIAARCTVAHNFPLSK